VDIFETGEKFIIEADLPGVSREDVDIDYRKRILTLSGERKTGEAKGRRSERPGGKFARRFVLPELIDTERIEAKFVCGVLRIEIPKPEESKTRKVTID
jgi:HSP20 family protein